MGELDITPDSVVTPDWLGFVIIGAIVCLTIGCIIALYLLNRKKLPVQSVTNKMSDLKITISKVDDDNFVGSLFFERERYGIYATDYIQAIDQAKEIFIKVVMTKVDK